MYRTVLLLTLFFPLGLSAQHDLKQLLDKENNNSIPYVRPGELAHFENKPVLLDAREKREYNVSHIEGAKYVGYEYFNLKKTLKQLPNINDTIVVYCSLGVRSEDIAEQLKAKGYKNVFNLYGGIFEWKNESYEVIDSKGNVTEKVHAFDQHWGKWLKKGEKVYD